MMNRNSKTKRIIEMIASLVLLSILKIIGDLAEVTLDTEWIYDIDIWINDFFVNTFVFFFMLAFLL